MRYKGKEIAPFESFYHNTTEEFFHGIIGGGISRCVKCDDSLATMVRTDKTMCLNSKVDGKQRLEMNENGTSNTLTSVQKDNLVVEPRVEQVGNIVDDTNIGFKKTQRGRIYSESGLSPTLNTCQGGGLEPKIAESQYRIRKLTPRECFRLMGLRDEDIDKIQSAGISNSQQYKMAGNSIVVDVLYHIFRTMFIERENPDKQLTIFDVL